MIKIVLLLIDRILTPSWSGPGSNSNEEVLHIPLSFRTGASRSDGLASLIGHS